jgi:UPF0755 protein
MSKYSYKHTQRSHPLRRLLVVAGIVLLILVALTIVVRRSYDQYLQPVSNSQAVDLVTIKTGESTTQIATQLQKDNLIRKSWAFEWYVRSQEVRGDLQAGTYALRPSESLPTIVGQLTQGKIATKLVTILPGQRLDQIRQALINAGFSPTDVDAALSPSQYQASPALVDKPVGNSLEGYLYPDSFQKSSSTSAQSIVEESLNEMNQHLTPTLRAAFAAQGLSTYQAIILASIVGQEVPGATDQAQVAQVFLSRLHQGMDLGSDVTADYGAILAGKLPSVSYDSPYNTLLHPGLPPTPISNVNAQSLNAVAHPASTTWLYFVSGDDGKTYFSQTLQQQQANVAQYCHKLCSEDN